MALPVQTQAKYWSIVAVVFLAALWFLGNVMTPFLIGGTIAYFLDPVADRLEAAGLKRIWATVLITTVAALAFVILALMVIPSLVNQTLAFFEAAPQLATDAQTFLTRHVPSLMDEDSILRQSIDALGTAVQQRGGELANIAFNSAMSVVGVIMLIVIVPVVAFYMLWDWDHMVAIIDDLLPRDHAPVIRDLAAQIDRTLASFIRGQLSVCMILGAYYAIALMLVGLQFGLVVGFVAGLISFIPYIGALVGGVLSIGLALLQYWGGIEIPAADGTIAHATDWVRIIAVAAIFLLGQFLEGNILSPNLVGQSVRLHPVWLIFALSAFGSIFGFVGMLIAVPVAAIIGVLVRHFTARYKQGLLYRGIHSADDT